MRKITLRFENIDLEKIYLVHLAKFYQQFNIKAQGLTLVCLEVALTLIASLQYKVYIDNHDYDRRMRQTSNYQAIVRIFYK